MGKQRNAFRQPAQRYQRDSGQLHAGLNDSQPKQGTGRRCDCTAYAEVLVLMDQGGGRNERGV